jgi:uncharacterized membrane protein YdjX (TVP38/TMEM64 family)
MKHYLFPLIILLILIGIYVSDLPHYFTLSALKTYESDLIHFVFKHKIGAAFLFIAIYALSVALFLPLGVYLSIAGGFLFPLPLATLYILMGFSAGCALVYLTIQDGVHTLFLKIAGPRLKRIEKAFQSNELNYLLFLRLVPFSPTGLINLAAIFFEVRFRTFLWTAFVGAIPSTLIFAEVGTRLDHILASGNSVSLYSLLTWKMSLALIALSLLSLLPAVLKKGKRI